MSASVQRSGDLLKAANDVVVPGVVGGYVAYHLYEWAKNRRDGLRLALERDEHRRVRLLDRLNGVEARLDLLDRRFDVLDALLDQWVVHGGDVRDAAEVSFLVGWLRERMRVEPSKAASSWGQTAQLALLTRRIEKARVAEGEAA